MEEVYSTGFFLVLIASGLFTQSSACCPTADIVVFQMVAGLGLRCLLGDLLLDGRQNDTASETEPDLMVFTGILHAYGSIWGVAVPGAVFNAGFERLKMNVDEATVSAVLRRGDG